MSTTGGDGSTTKPKPVVQYIFLRRDLEWPAGAMAAQAAHASLAAVTEALRANHEPTAQYVSADNLPRMTKQVYGVDTLEELEKVRDTWAKKIVPEDGTEEPLYYWWMEQPENIPSAMATWPVERTNKVSKVIKGLKLTYF
eukprot:CAMPEP_0194045474 /NCGR_PEP_ID=MMETSP0009_2-20130614/16808_1 /TAXON_ID=210454 /ORGANISM="Grammatophora oceanica, Strain CCMP 410" /LENGTH=140 /DNA_ID=CAMNT_0038690337 /DNA_START=14 /DNA_END=439 /DNA_ORIENTATION=+